jgi:hypothetical protein
LAGNATTEYRTHPSFWWDHDVDGYVDNNETIPGIWVGKFETTPDKNSECFKSENFSCDSTTTNPTILPNIISLKQQNIEEQFYMSRNISKKGNIYGLNNEKTNAHMMKNSDWGAVAYLSHSDYGINKEIIRSEGDKTGCGEANQNGNCQNVYGKSTTYPQSTTGNISGIFDMSGVTPENVMARLNGEDMYDYEVTIFQELPADKYYDKYEEIFETFGIYGYQIYPLKCTIETCGGHALSETSNWYDNTFGFYYNGGYHWFFRGENRIFDIDGSYGGDSGYISWRSVIVPKFGE